MARRIATAAMGTACILAGHAAGVAMAQSEDACGPIPADHPIVSLSDLAIGMGVRVNGNEVGDETESPNAIDVDGVAIVIPEPGLPDLDPGTFPVTEFGTTDSSGPTVPAGTYRRVEAGMGGSLDFSGGTYQIQTLELARNASAELAPGDYFLQELTMGRNATLLVSPPGEVRIYVAGALGAGLEATLNPGGSVADLQVFLYQGAIAEFGRDSGFDGVLYTPFAGPTVRMGREATLAGAIVTAGTLDLAREVDIKFGEDVQDEVETVTTCQGAAGAGADHLELGHDGSGINCLAEPVSLRAVDAAGTTFAAYQETVTLQTSTGHGTWSVATGSGVLADPMPGDGHATYTFDAADQGEVVLALADTHAETVNIGAGDASITDDDLEGPLTFRPFGFLAEPAPVPAQVAGRAFDLDLIAAGQTPSQPECGVIEEYDGDRALRLWSTYDDPASGSTPVRVQGAAIGTDAASATEQTITFGAGRARLAVRYDDAGAIRLHARDDAGIGDPVAGGGDEIIGGAGPIVVRPFGFHVEASGNPGATDASGPAYGAAGVAFPVEVSAAVWSAADDTDGDGVPDAGAILADNPLAPNFGQEATPEAVQLSHELVEPAGGDPGLVTGDTVVSGFAGGRATGMLAWDEVGIMRLLPSASGGDYLGGGPVTGAASGPIGRFHPEHFRLVSGNVMEGCLAAFTYMDQPAVDLSFRVEAREAGGSTTANYGGPFATGVVEPLAENADDGVDLSARISWPAATWAAGVYEVAGSLQQFIRAAAVDGPFDDLAIGLAVTDPDADLADPDMDPAGAGDCTTPANTCTGARIDDTAVRFGRLLLDDALGSELQDLTIPLAAQYFDGTLFVDHAEDACTTYAAADASFDPASYTGELDPGETSPVGAGTVMAGRHDPANPLSLSAPGAGNTGSVQVRLAVPAWLRYDWNGIDEGADGDPFDDDPGARATFGIFQGSDAVIYRQEAYGP